MKAINCNVEYLTNPIGIDIVSPRIRYNCEGGIKQTANQIILYKDGEVIYDSKKVKTSSMKINLPLKFSSRDQIFYKIKLWDENDIEGEFSPLSSFEMGLLKPTDWKASWITGNYKVNKKNRYPVDCFKKEFQVTDVKKARLYITSCGLYEARINSQRVGEFVLAPGHTDYRKRIQYQTYDVTSLLKEGTNSLTVELADGFYRGSIGAWGIRNQYGTETKLLIQLEIYDSNNNIQTIVSDGSFGWSNDGPILFADNKDGEIVDSRKIPTYSKKAKVTKCNITPQASNNVFCKEHEHLTDYEVINTPSNKQILKFKQNIAGYISFKIKAKEGQKIQLIFGEMLTNDGELTLKNIQCATKKRKTPLQRIIYTCKEGINEYKTKFSIFGFQYVEVVGCDVNEGVFEAIAVYSDIKDVLKFNSSNDLLNKFVSCTRWSGKNNSLDVPTDCPTRERHGWTGDSQLFFITASYLFNYAPFAKKHLNDIFDFQKKNGMLPQIAPYGGVDFYMYTMNGAPGWADVGILIPYRYYKQYNDIDILEEYYPKMEKYASFIIKRMGKKTILSKPLHLKHKYRKYVINYGQAYGEWAEPASIHPTVWTDMILPKPEVATAYAYWMMKLMKEISLLLNKVGEAKKYQELELKIKEAYQQLRKTKQYSLDTDRQAMLVRPLYLDLLEGEDKEYAKKRLIKALDNFSWRVGTGFLSTPLILDVLSDIDIEYAYKLLENEEMPGWLFMPKEGATTIWESWEGTQSQGGIGSLDHYSKGSVLEWVFKTMCGINIDGENKFIIAPHPGGHFSFADLTYESVFGKVSCSWKKEKDKYIYKITIPSNCQAKIILPNGIEKIISAGTYEF